jgi:hypothetical protein
MKRYTKERKRKKTVNNELNEIYIYVSKYVYVKSFV